MSRLIDNTIKAEWTNADALDLQPTCNQLATDCISREVVLNWLENEWDGVVVHVFDGIRHLPSAQPERDIPIKPIETTDRAWGIPHRQAVCPKCDYYLGHVAFLGDYKGKRITYCETCGQAIDWEGWDFDE